MHSMIFCIIRFFLVNNISCDWRGYRPCNAPYYFTKISATDPPRFR